MPLYPTFPDDDIVTPRDVLDAPGRDYVYDALVPVPGGGFSPSSVADMPSDTPVASESVPEPTTTLGLLGLAALGFGIKRKRQAKNVRHVDS